MEKVAALFIQFGLDFHYANEGSDGETITTDMLEVYVYTDKERNLHLDYETESSTYPVSDESWEKVLSNLKDILVAETC